MATATFDRAKAEEFAGRMRGVLNGGTLALLTSIGHRTGLFDTLANLPPATGEEIARAAGLNERYVREWLGGMVAGRVVEYDPTTGSYSLPPEHAASLTRSRGTDNLAAFMQYIPLLGVAEEKILECFRAGGGVPYSAYPRLRRLLAEDTARVFDAALIDRILPLVPGLIPRLRAGIDVLEIGCGYGHALNLMARAFPRSAFTGHDISEEAIEVARFQARRWKLDNISFNVEDAAAMSERCRYDLITAFGTIHDQAQPTAVLRAIAEGLRPGGVFLMQNIAASSQVERNIGNPIGPTLYAFSLMHCMPVSLHAGGEGLGAVWGEETARRMLGRAGFVTVGVEQIDADKVNSYYIATR